MAENSHFDINFFVWSFIEITDNSDDDERCAMKDDVAGGGFAIALTIISY
jgi:hypothetical protein